jgi:nucleoside-diphosphate-sugar epimerase
MGRPCLVTGSASQIASWLVPRLIEAGWEPHIIARRRRPDYGPSVHWHQHDLADRGRDFPAADADVLFHTASLDLLAPWIAQMHSRGVRRVLAFSTTSIFTKAESGARVERERMAAIAQAEERIAEASAQCGMRVTILRPTLIYGGRFGDRNISEIARIVTRLGFFPLYGGGTGLRQPVHAADLAEACLLACDCPATFGRAYNLGGGETLSYRRMVERVFETLGLPPRLFPTPGWAFSLAAAIARRRPAYRHLTAEMALRMRQDLVADVSDASRDFGYSPRPFAPVISL